MAHHPAALKTIRKDEARRLRNKTVISDLRTRMKQLDTLIATGKADEATAALRELTQRLDRAAARRKIHPNLAARKKSRLTKRLQALAARRPA